MLIPVTDPAPVLARADAKSHLRVEHTDDDTYIDTLIVVATTAVADRVERTLGQREWELRLSSDDVVCGYDLRLPMPPLVQVLSVAYRDTDGAPQTYAPERYRTFGVGAPTGGGIRLTDGAFWPVLQDGPEAVTIRFKAGYQEVPEPLRQAVLMMVGTLYANRGEMIRQEMVEDTAIKALLAPYRVWSV